MKFLIFVAVCLVYGCSNPSSKNAPGASSPATVIPHLRDSVRKSAVASYLVPVGDPRLERFFGVDIYETRFTFKYLLSMQFDGMLQTDTLKLPDFDTWPKVEVKPGKEKFSCIIGFLDKQNVFREYKLLSAKDNSLTLTVIHGYAVTEDK